MKAFKFIFYIILVFYLLVIALLYSQQERMLFPRPFDQNLKVDNQDFTQVSIPTEDGETLFGLYHPASEGEATIIVFHGNADAAIYQQVKSEALTSAGFGVLLLEYRGYPGSSGTPSEQGLFADGRAGYDFVRKQDDSPIGLYGHSLGTGVAVKLASEREVSALVLEAPYDSVLALAQDRYPWAPVRFLLKHKFRSDLYISKTSAPILMLHGDRDYIIPMKNGRRLFEKAPKGTQFEVMKGVGHVNFAEYYSEQKAIAFFRQNLK